MLFCLAAGKLTAVNAQIRLVTGLTTAALYIRHWPVISRLWSNLLARIQQKTNLQQGPNSVKKILSLVHTSCLIWTSGNLQKI